MSVVASGYSRTSWSESSMAISGTDWLEVPTIYKAYVRGCTPKIWPYMVQYLHFRILEFPLKSGLVGTYPQVPSRSRGQSPQFPCGLPPNFAISWVMWVKQCHFYHPWLGTVNIPPINMVFWLGDGKHGIVLPTWYLSNISIIFI